MSREIKFRAWDKQKKVMYSPSSISWDKDGKTLWLCDIHGTNTLEYELINPTSELMQFTGLKDKNGKEIYEGDVMMDEAGEIYKVGFWKFRWQVGEDAFEDMNFDYLEIIGNIYSNPELLPPKV